MSDNTIFGYPVVYVDDERVVTLDSIVLGGLSCLTSDLRRKDWPEYYRRRCEVITAAIRDLELEK